MAGAGDRPRNPRRGDVWWLEDPDIGRRPTLVLTRDSAVEALSGLLVAPITRTIRNIASELVLDEDDGMPTRCAAVFDNLRTVPKSLLTQRLTSIDESRMHAACEALRFAVDC